LLQKHLAVIDQALRSFQLIGAGDLVNAKPLRLKILAAPAGARYADLAKHSPLGKHAEAQLRLLNGHYPIGEPLPGQPLKVVE
jgi:predicted Zn-dependent protease